MSKMRLDVAVFQGGLAESREKARALIMEGLVYVEGQKRDKPGEPVAADAKIEVIGQRCPYVSRGGLKLEKALDTFGVTVENKTVMDVGASTGGFTDCMLKRGAKKVYAVDSGTGQLDYTLRKDGRVAVMEKTNFRYLDAGAIPDKIDVAVMDVSFISVLKLADNLKNFLKDDSRIIVLIKPQFEAEKGVPDKGVVSDMKMHVAIVKRVVDGMMEKHYFLRNLTHSPIKGPKGNIEFLAEFSLNKPESEIDGGKIIKECVEEAHRSFK